jgi:hypothetical protein
MNRIALCGFLCLLIVGCQQPRTYQFDFGEEPNFQWDGKVRVTKTYQWRFGPFLTINEDWDVDRVEFGSQDGRIASIDTRGDSARATIDPNLPTGHQIPGMDVYRSGIDIAFTAAGRSVKKLAGETYRSATQPAGPDIVRAINAPLTTHPIPDELKPYAQHVDRLSQADWCAIALKHADSVTTEFRVPGENLRIVFHGNPRQYGPGVLEVWTADGRLLKRFDQKQATTRAVKAKAQSQSTATSASGTTD